MTYQSIAFLMALDALLKILILLKGHHNLHKTPQRMHIQLYTYIYHIVWTILHSGQIRVNKIWFYAKGIVLIWYHGIIAIPWYNIMLPIFLVCCTQGDILSRDSYYPIISYQSVNINIAQSKIKFYIRQYDIACLRCEVLCKLWIVPLIKLKIYSPASTALEKSF